MADFDTFFCYFQYGTTDPWIAVEHSPGRTRIYEMDAGEEFVVRTVRMAGDDNLAGDLGGKFMEAIIRGIGK